MNPILRDILDLLDVERIEENLYRGRNAARIGARVRRPGARASDRRGESNDRRAAPIAFDPRLFSASRRLERADPVRGRPHPRRASSFTTRRVAAIQHGRAIFSMSSSWQTDEPGLEHSVPMPDVPSPESLRSDKDAYAEIAKMRPEVKRFAYRFDAIDSRQVENILMGNTDQAHPPYKHTWLKTRDPLPDNPEVHLCMLAYMSDLDFMSTSMLPHGRSPGGGDRSIIPGREPRSRAVVSPRRFARTSGCCSRSRVRARPARAVSCAVSSSTRAANSSRPPRRNV